MTRTIKRKSSEKDLEKLDNDVSDNLMQNGCPEQGTDLDAQTDMRIEQVCGAWKTADQAAYDVWNSIHNSLLDSDLVFGYKSMKPGSDLQQLVVVRNVRWENGQRTPDNTYGVGVIYSGYTMLLPKVPHTYLTDTLIEDLIKSKPGDHVIKSYKYMIDVFK